MIFYGYRIKISFDNMVIVLYYNFKELKFNFIKVIFNSLKYNKNLNFFRKKLVANNIRRKNKEWRFYENIIKGEIKVNEKERTEFILTFLREATEKGIISIKSNELKKSLDTKLSELVDKIGKDSKCAEMVGDIEDELGNLIEQIKKEFFTLGCINVDIFESYK